MKLGSRHLSSPSLGGFPWQGGPSVPGQPLLAAPPDPLDPREKGLGASLARFSGLARRLASPRAVCEGSTCYLLLCMNAKAARLRPAALQATAALDPGEAHRGEGPGALQISQCLE